MEGRRLKEIGCFGYELNHYTAFFYLGEWIEYGVTPGIFTNPAKKQTEDYVTGQFG